MEKRKKALAYADLEKIKIPMMIVKNEGHLNLTPNYIKVVGFYIYLSF